MEEIIYEISCCPRNPISLPYLHHVVLSVEIFVSTPYLLVRPSMLHCGFKQAPLGSKLLDIESERKEQASSVNRTIYR